jgi:hypothetical protein
MLNRKENPDFKNCSAAFYESGISRRNDSKFRMIIGKPGLSRAFMSKISSIFFTIAS